MVRNDDRPVGQPPVGGPVGSPPPAIKPAATKCTDPPGGATTRAKDQGPVKVAMQGTAAPTLSLVPDETDNGKVAGGGSGRPVAADEIVKGSNGPHNAFGPRGHETRDSYALGMRAGFYRLGFSRTRVSGESHAGLLANTKGGGFDAGFMTRTPFGPHFSIAWGMQVQATAQKLGETTLLQINPDLLAQARYQTDNHQLTVNAGLYNKVGVGWNKGAVDRNVQRGKALADKIEKEFESLKGKAKGAIDKVKAAGETFIGQVKSAIPTARDQFASLASQRVSAQLGDAAGKILPILTEEVNTAFTGYFNNLSAAVGTMQSAMQSAASASTPSQMQAALSAFSVALGQLQAATGPGSLDAYIVTMQNNLANRLGPEAAGQMAALGEILNTTASDVGGTLMASLNQAANTAITTGNRILSDLLGDAANALGNSADAASSANAQREQMTTVAMTSRLGVGMDYQYRMPFLSSTKHDFNTVLDVGGNYYHPLMEMAWADKGAPNPMVVGAAVGPTADLHAGVRFTKWWGNVGLGADIGAQGMWTKGAGVSVAPQAGVSLSASF
ncbi:MAG: hypothetical protein H7338_17690 [Candidatus Sericytochromatia bacterium]|nr:hypothetical protein [Candidatus Sericytochromatia bacterium]